MHGRHLPTGWFDRTMAFPREVDRQQFLKAHRCPEQPIQFLSVFAFQKGQMFEIKSPTYHRVSILGQALH
jgi:hypothetical protein